jgi:hypothetical protein
VDLALGAAVAMTAHLATVLIVWVRERSRSARACEMARRLPAGSRYTESSAHVIIEVGTMNLRAGISGSVPE